MLRLAPILALTACIGQTQLRPDADPVRVHVEPSFESAYPRHVHHAIQWWHAWLRCPVFELSERADADVSVGFGQCHGSGCISSGDVRIDRGRFLGAPMSGLGFQPGRREQPTWERSGPEFPRMAILAHELGHVLGLGHGGAVMAPRLQDARHAVTTANVQHVREALCEG